VFREQWALLRAAVPQAMARKTRCRSAVPSNCARGRGVVRARRADGQLEQAIAGLGANTALLVERFRSPGNWWSSAATPPCAGVQRGQLAGASVDPCRMGLRRPMGGARDGVPVHGQVRLAQRISLRCTVP
jgi:hypothetical protein